MILSVSTIGTCDALHYVMGAKSGISGHAFATAHATSGACHLAALSFGTSILGLIVAHTMYRICVVGFSFQDTFTL